MPLPPPFLGLSPETIPADARVAILPVPYEGTVSYLGGTADGPRALLEASVQVELYDEVLAGEPFRVGIRTEAPLPVPRDPAGAVEAVRAATAARLKEGRFVVVLGGEHSISTGTFRALREVHGEIGVVQLDAHADLRDAYEGSPYSHASVMARIREETDAVVQLGIRSLSAEEAALIRARNYRVGYMHRMREERFDLDATLAALPDKIFLTFDIDALDLALVRATGTPEPGGFTWPEINDLLATLFAVKQVVGFDMVELCGGDAPSAFCAARLLYRMIGWRFAGESAP